MHYAPGTPAEPRETLHDLVGASGPSIHWPRAALFLAAVLAADLPAFVIEPLLTGYSPPVFFYGVYLLGDVVLTGAVLLACRWFRSPIVAALMAPVFYFAGMLPVRIWQIISYPPEIRLQFAATMVLFGLAGNFLMLLGLHFGLRWLRPLFLALAVGGAAGNLLTEILLLVRFVAVGSTPTLMGELRGVAMALGGSVLFAGVYWVGTLIPAMKLPERARAEVAAAPVGVTGAAADLQRAADFRSVRKRLRIAAFGSIFFGLFAVGLGIYGLKDSPLNALLILLGFFLLGEGIWLLVQPTPTGMVVDGIALCLVGLWNIMVTLANLAAGAGGPTFALALGFVQIGWGIGSFRRYGRFAHLTGGIPSAEDMKRVDALVAGIAEASMKTSADIIEFTAGGQQWKGRLAPDLAVFVAGAEEEVVLAGKSEVSITPQEPVAGKAFAATFQLGTHSHKGSLSPEAYQRYEIWRSSR